VLIGSVIKYYITRTFQILLQLNKNNDYFKTNNLL